jgi:hypothetical protein
MNNSRIFRFLLSTALVVGFSTVGLAQATRTWVSGVGDDANPCSRTAPCKTFAGAISKTAAAGEINVIDSGGFGALTITKSITVRAVGVEAGVLVAGTNGFVVQVASTDFVTIDGLDFEGLGAPQFSLNGVSISGGGKVFIKNCRINGFHNGNGVNLSNNTGTPAHAFIRDCFITNNLGGVNAGGTSNIASIINTEMDSNATFSVQANGAGTVLGIANSVLNDSPTAISLLNGGQAFSFGPSNVVSGGGSFTGGPLPFR